MFCRGCCNWSKVLHVRVGYVLIGTMCYSSRGCFDLSRVLLEQGLF